jgi:hypothetical protein
MKEEKLNEIRVAMGNLTIEEIIGVISKEVEKNGYIILDKHFKDGLTDRIDVAAVKFTHSGEFKLDPTPYHKMWSIYKSPTFKKPTWEERHPFWDRFRTGLITFIFTVTAGLILFPLTTGKQSREINQLKMRLDALSSELTKIQTGKTDSSKPPK